MEKLIKACFGTTLAVGLTLSPMAFGETPPPTGTMKHEMPQKDQMKDEQSADKIQQSIKEDKQLSGSARDVNVMLGDDGKFTLTGVVPTEAEKSSIEKKAADVVGASKVKNQLKVQKQ